MEEYHLAQLKIQRLFSFMVFLFVCILIPVVGGTLMVVGAVFALSFTMIFFLAIFYCHYRMVRIINKMIDKLEASNQ